MSKLLFTLILLLIASECVQAQVHFEKRYANHPGAEVKALRQTFDGGYIMVGGDAQEAAIIRTDEFGDSLWTKNYTNPGQFAFNLEQCADSGFIVTGYAFYNGCDAYLRKLNPDGTEAWFQYYDGSGCEWGQTLKQLPDGGFILAGTEITRTDSAGNLIWTQATSTGNQAMSMVITSDGNLVYSSTSASTASGAWLTKMDFDGNEIWTKHYTDLYFYNNSDNNITETSDGEFILVGRNVSVPSGLIKKVSSNGTLVWTKNLSTETLASTMSVIESDSGGYLACGFFVDSVGVHAYLHRMDESGNPVWDKGYDDASFQSLVQCKDGGYAAAGYKESSSGKRKFFLIKIGGQYPLNTFENHETIGLSLVISPIPSSGNIHLEDCACFGSAADVYDINGQLIHSSILAPDMDLSFLKTGLFLLNTICGQARFMILK
jgi:hypothetical protein